MLTENLAQSYSAHLAIKEMEVAKARRETPFKKVSRLRRFIATTVLAGMTFSGAAVAASPAAFATPPAQTADEQALIAQVKARTEATRSSMGLDPLVRDSRLDASAQLWADRMAANSNAAGGNGLASMVHSNTVSAGGGSSSPLYFANAIPSGWSQAAENIAWDRNSGQSGTARADLIYNAWRNSAPHWNTITLPRYDSIGYAVAQDNFGSYYVSVDFGDYFNGAWVAPSAPSAPSAVTNLITTANTDGSVSVSFTAPAETVTGYEVSTDGGNTFTSWNGTSALTGLTVGQSYDIVVRALNTVGTGVASVISTVVPQSATVGATPPVTAPPVAGGGGGGVSFGGGSGVEAPVPAPERRNTVTTVAGNSRYGTAVALAHKTNPAPSQIVIASGENSRLVDSVSAAPFAKSVNAPLLLTNGAGLSQEVRDYITATPSIRGAVIVGGEQAVSEQVMSDLNALGLATARLNGNDRYSTSAMLAQKTLLNTGGFKVFITRGTGSLADAVSASGTASALGAAVLIVPNSTENLDGWSRSFAQGKTVIAVGGTDVLPLDVASEMGATERIFGASRYETSQAVANYAVRLGVNTDRAFVANGAEGRLVDALTASAAGSVSLLVPADGFGADATKWLSANKTTEVIAVGGMTPTR